MRRPAQLIKWPFDSLHVTAELEMLCEEEMSRWHPRLLSNARDICNLLAVPLRLL